MKTIKINAIQFSNICGQEESKLLLLTNEILMVGERVELKVYTTNSDEPTGASICRYIKDITAESSYTDEDLFMTLHLSAFNPTNL